MSTWPPPKEFIDFIESIHLGKVNFDPKVLEETEESSVKTRYAGHCLIFCRTKSSTKELDDNEIHFKAHLNVSFFFTRKSPLDFSSFLRFLDALAI